MDDRNRNNAAPAPYPKDITSPSSIKSHHSVSVAGSHPFGSLRIHRTGRSSDVHDSIIEDEETSPPPLDAPSPAGWEGVGNCHSAIRSGIPHDLSQDVIKTSDPTLRHGMGGGDVVLILDLPEVFTVGYDNVSFTAKHFAGVRDVPKGPHFFWIAHADGISTRQGFWVLSSGVDQVHVVQWDKFNEVLGDAARAESRIQADSVDNIHSKLVPFGDPGAINVTNGHSEDASSAIKPSVWSSLTSSISRHVLSQIMGHQSGNWCVNTTDRVRGSFLMPAEAELDRAMSSQILQNRELSFTFSQDTKTFSTTHTGADRTEEATDSTRHITGMCGQNSRSLLQEEMVGELQFAFIVGMHLGNDACIQQWWHMLLRLALRAYQLPIEHPTLAAALLQTLAAQLSYDAVFLESSILDYDPARAKDLRIALTVYKRRFDELLLGLDAEKRITNDQLAASTAFSRVEATAASLGWDLRGQYLRKGIVTLEDGEEVELEMSDLQAEDERGEWAPEVVELDEGGRQRDLVSWSD